MTPEPSSSGTGQQVGKYRLLELVGRGAMGRVYAAHDEHTDRKVAVTLTPAARAWLATAGYDRVFGARPLARVIQKEVRDVLTDQILFGALEHGGTVTIDLVDDRLTFAYETRDEGGRGGKVNGMD